MSVKHKVTSPLSIVISLLFSIPPAIFFFRWTSLGRTSPELGYAEKVRAYMGYFPWIHNINIIYVISIICCIIVMLFAARSFRHKSLPVRLLMFFLVLFAAIVLLFDLYYLV